MARGDGQVSERIGFTQDSSQHLMCPIGHEVLEGHIEREVVQVIKSLVHSISPSYWHLIKFYSIAWSTLEHMILDLTH